MFYNIAKQKTCLKVSVEAMTSIITLSHTSKSTKTPIHNSLKKYIYISILSTSVLIVKVFSAKLMQK